MSKLSSSKISRLEFLKRTSIISAFLLTGCSEVNYLLGNYPSKYKKDEILKEKVLSAFVDTVIPGAAGYNPETLCLIFNDEYYAFNNYCSFFISDIASRSEKLFYTDQFFSLDESQRTAVIRDALAQGGMMKKIYTAAIFMTQVSFYSGIYLPDDGCSLIEFNGTNTGFSDEEMFYPDAEKYCAHEITADGNYN